MPAQYFNSVPPEHVKKKRFFCAVLTTKKPLFKAFIKSFETPQRSVKIKIFNLIFSLRPGLGREGLSNKIFSSETRKMFHD